MNGISRVVPTPIHVQHLLAFGTALERDPVRDAHLLVHCHAGVSRSSASMALLIAQAMPDSPADAIFAEILQIRPQIWPNLRIVEMGDRALGRNGSLIVAAHRVYRMQIGRRPEIANELSAGGRAREVEGAFAVPVPALVPLER